MLTERLYYQDPLLNRFEARVIAISRLGSRPAVVLDRSAFYPESGGQMADRGTLGDSEVLDVQLDAEKSVLHVLPQDAPIPKVGAVVLGQIRMERRRRFMAMHTGQHMFSCALSRVAGLETVSARLGEKVCTLDVDRAPIPSGALEEALAMVEEKIEANLSVKASFPSAAQLKALHLRRAPKVTDGVRIVEVEGFDITPCGGTHVFNTAQVRVLRVLGTERKRGHTRILFDAGARAVEGLIQETAALAQVGSSLTSGPLDVPAAVAKLKQDLQGARAQLKALGRLAADGLAHELRAQEGAVIAELPSAALLGPVAQRLAAEGRLVLLAAKDGDKMRVVAQRGAELSMDCGQIIKRACALGSGRGGGRPDRAEGKIDAGSDWTALAKTVLGGLHDDG